MSVAEAIGEDKPMFLFFYPVDVCRARYCPQASYIRDALQAEFGNAVNFVYVPVEAVSASSDDADVLPIFHNLEVWSVPPIANWLPESELTPFGITVAAPSGCLMDANGNVLVVVDQGFTVDDLQPYINS